jgi:DNA-directed RNA polymerase subunit RPC12/RpoP
MRINHNTLLEEYVGKCLHCSKEFVLLAKPMKSPTTIKCKHCESEHCFVKLVKKLKSNKTQQHRKDMCEKCQEQGG